LGEKRAHKRTDGRSVEGGVAVGDIGRVNRKAGQYETLQTLDHHIVGRGEWEAGKWREHCGE
jgi:hypothetical protein